MRNIKEILWQLGRTLCIGALLGSSDIATAKNFGFVKTALLLIQVLIRQAKQKQLTLSIAF